VRRLEQVREVRPHLLRFRRRREFGRPFPYERIDRAHRRYVTT
jgi:hypothetical protein